MRKRLSLPILGSLTIAVILLSSIPTASQNQASPGDAWDPPRTPWGEPDLRGIWDYWTFTPLERPEEFAGRDELTEEEAASLAATRREEAIARFGQGGYNQDVWTERSRLTARTPAEQRRVEAYRASRGGGADGPEDRGLPERCIVGFSTGPPLLPGGYSNFVQVFQVPGYVVLALEMVHDVRFVPLDNRPHLPGHIRQWLGDSRGHWEGNTLVIDTTNFPDQIAQFSTTGRSGESLHLTERLTLVDPDTLSYEFTVDNPAIFTRSFSARFPMKRTESPIYEYACHEGNYGLYNILSAARAEDAR